MWESTIIKVTDTECNYSKIYNSITECAKDLGVKFNLVSDRLKNPNRQNKIYPTLRFEYVERGKHEQPRPIYMIDTLSGERFYYKSISDCAYNMDFHTKIICKCLNVDSSRKTIAGYRFEYVEVLDE